MKKFSEMGIEVKKSDMFDVEQISINYIINCEVEVMAFHTDVKTGYGEGRYVVKVRHEGKVCKFFTNCNRIKETLNMIPEKDFPFLATIKQQRCGKNGSTYYFT